MGGKYSKVVNPCYPALKTLEGISLTELKGKVTGIAKHKQKSGVYFLTKTDILWAFEKLTELQLYQIISSFDISQNGNIPSLDFWGALALLSADGNDDKINFCFKLMDLNNDDYLSYSDLVVVMSCATRGVAKLRGYTVMPYEYLDRMAMEAFRVCKKSLSKDGEISILDFRAVLLSDDLVGQYLSNLGVPVVEVDAAALVAKRSNLLKEAIALRAKIADTLCAIEESEEEEQRQAGERGGDVELLRVSEAELEHGRSQHALAAAAEHRRRLREKGLDVSSEVAAFALPVARHAHSDSGPRRQSPTKRALELTAHASAVSANPALPRAVVAEDPTHPSRVYLQCDNSVFADADMSPDKKNANTMYGEGFRTALLEVWMRLPQDQDLMAELDAYTVIALFDNVMVTLTYEAAQHCLQHLSHSTIGRCCFEDVLRWYLLYGADLATREVKAPAVAAKEHAGVTGLIGAGSSVHAGSLQSTVTQSEAGDAWTEFTGHCHRSYTSMSALLKDAVSKAAYLRAVLDRVDQLPPSRNLKYPNYRHPDRAAAPSTPTGSSRPSAAQSGGTREMGYMMKLVEFRKLTSKKPSNLQLKYVFNKPNVKVLPKSESQEDGEVDSDGVRRSGSGERGRAAAAGRGITVGGGGGGGGAGRSRSRSRGKSPGKAASGDDTDLSGASKTAGGQQDKYTTEAERLPATKTIRVEEIDDWKLTFRLAFTANPFTNLSTKRPKDSSRVRSVQGRDYIEDFANLQAQDLLDYYNIQQERQLEEQTRREAEEATAAAAAAMAAALAGFPIIDDASSVGSQHSKQPPPHRPRPKQEPTVFNSVSWFCLELRSGLQPEQASLFAAALRNFFTAVPYHLRAPIYQDVLVKVFTVFKTTGMGSQAPRQADKVAGKFLSSLTGKGDDSAEADALFLAAPRVMLVALFHPADHFAEVEKQLLASDVFLTRAVSTATLDVQLMQTFEEIMKHSAEYVLYGERLFGPQEEEMGSDNMNPIRFAKEVRAKRRRYLELAQSADRMPRAELAQHCKEMGLKDTGTLAELARRAREGFELAAELTGYGELSRFGEDVVTRIFHTFKVHPIAKSDEDGGLTLWEFNRLLYHIDAPTLYDAAEYQRLMKELQLLVDRDQRLRLQGLQAYYRNSGRLKAENDLLGVGSLDEQLSGRFSFSSTFEPDALTSVFNLLGANTLFVPELVRRLTAWAAVRDVRLEAELDRLSDLFAILDTDGGKQFSRDVLRSPGWLSRAFSTVSATLGDGEEGIVPALRRSVRQAFEGQYAEWEEVFQVTFLEAVQKAVEGNAALKEVRALWAKQDRRLARKARREAEAEAAATEQQAGTSSGTQSDSRALSHYHSSTQARAQQDPDDAARLVTSSKDPGPEREGFSGGDSDQPAEWSTGHHDGAPSEHGEEGVYHEVKDGDEDGDEEEDDGEEFEVVDYAAQERALLEEELERVVASTLPPPQNKQVDLPKLVLQLKEDLVFLYHLRDSEGVELSLEQSTAIFERKRLLIAKIKEAQRLQEEAQRLASAHACALYDAVRLFTVGLASAGLGSRDCCLRGYADGLALSQYLPRAMGELAPVKQQYVEKVERARQRKASALAALERERRRRDMTEEEREELRREAHAAQLLVWAKEEAAMFARAFAALSEAREERKSVAQLAEMTGLWEALVAAKESRYPEEVATAACQNALACVLLEFFGSRHPKGAPAQYLLESAVNTMTKTLEGLEGEIAVIEEARSPFALPARKDKPISSADLASAGSPTKVPVPAPSAHVGAGAGGAVDGGQQQRDPFEEMQRIGLSCMLVMVNYVTVLVETESAGKLQQALPLKRRIYEMYHRLSAQQQERLAQGVVPQLGEIPMMPYGRVRATLEMVVEEMEQYLELAAKRAALEAEEELRRRLAEEAALQEATQEEEGETTDPKKLRKEKKEKYALQRRLDAAKRVEVMKQRKALYEMIQTDRITAIFNARARGGAPVEAPGWGEQNEQAMAALSSELDTLTASLVGSAMEGDATHAAALARKRANDDKARSGGETTPNRAPAALSGGLDTSP